MQNISLGYLFPADTRHVLKFCKDPFRGVDEISCEKEAFVKQKATCHTAAAYKVIYCTATALCRRCSYCRPIFHFIFATAHVVLLIN